MYTESNSIILAVRQTIVVVLLQGIVERYLEYIDVFAYFVQSQNKITLNDNAIDNTALQYLINSVV